jgi:hypothetical protein
LVPGPQLNNQRNSRPLTDLRTCFIDDVELSVPEISVFKHSRLILDARNAIKRRGSKKLYTLGNRPVKH